MKQECQDKHSDQERRKRAALELGQLEIEDVPDPATLSRQLEDAHNPDGVI